MTADIVVRQCRDGDRAACLALFDSNTPEYFHPAEREAFSRSLGGSDFRPPRLLGDGGPKGRFYVVESAGVVIGCGGWYLDGSVAVLSWGMVLRSRQRQGIGRFLLQERLKAIRADHRAKSVRVRTTPSVAGFFQLAEFKLVSEGLSGLVDEVPLVELALTL
jgi:GNAT superfamily N-acetyltransferase